MKLLRSLLILPMAVVLSLSGCSTLQLDTANKKAYATEIAINEVLDKLHGYVKTDRFTKLQLIRLYPIVIKTQQALEALQIAAKYKNTSGMELQLKLLTEALPLLKKILSNAEKSPLPKPKPPVRTMPTGVAV